MNEMARLKRPSRAIATKIKAEIVGYPQSGKSMLALRLAEKINGDVFIHHIMGTPYEYFDLMDLMGINKGLQDCEVENGKHDDPSEILKAFDKLADSGAFKNAACVVFDPVSEIYKSRVTKVMLNKEEWDGMTKDEAKAAKRAKQEKLTHAHKSQAMQQLKDAAVKAGDVEIYMINHYDTTSDTFGRTKMKELVSDREQMRMSMLLNLKLRVLCATDAIQAEQEVKSDKVQQRVYEYSPTDADVAQKLGIKPTDVEKLRNGVRAVKIEYWRFNAGDDYPVLWDDAGFFQGFREKLEQTLKNVPTATWADYASGKPFPDENTMIRLGILHTEHNHHAFGNPGNEAIKSDGKAGINGEVDIAKFALAKLKRGDYRFQTRSIEDMGLLSKAWVKLIADKLAHQRKILNILGKGPIGYKELVAEVGEEHTKTATAVLAKDGFITKTEDGLIRLVGGAE